MVNGEHTLGRLSRSRSRLLLCSLLAGAFCLSAESRADTIASVPLDDALKQSLLDAVSDQHQFADQYDEQVWLVSLQTSLAPYLSDSEEALELLRLIYEEAARARLDPSLVLAVIQVESGFDRYALSHAGAQGLMQVMSFWKNEIGREDDNLMDPKTNLRYGCTVLRHYLDRENGDVTRALARYNGSLGQTWYPQRVFQALNNWQ